MFSGHQDLNQAQDIESWVETGIQCREKKSYEEAFRLFQLAGDRGDVRAWSYLVDMYEKEEGIKRNNNEIARLTVLIREAANRGEPLGQCALGVIYYYGYSAIKQSDEEAVKWFRLAMMGGNEKAKDNLSRIAEGGNREAQYAMGEFSLNMSDEAGAIKWFLLAALLDDERAKQQLSAMVQTGHAYAQWAMGKLSFKAGDVATALNWFQLSTEQGCANGQCSLGAMYQHGKGVEQSYEKAIYYYQLSAQQGYATAQCNLGFMVHMGYGVEQDYNRAIQLYQLAAIGGEEQAKINLRYIANEQSHPKAYQALYRLGLSDKPITASWNGYDTRLWYRKRANRPHEQEDVLDEIMATIDTFDERSEEVDIPMSLFSTSTQVLLSERLSRYQLKQLLGSQYDKLLEAICSLRSTDENIALEEDHHTAVLASLQALLSLYPINDDSVKEKLLSVLIGCLPVYRIARNGHMLEHLSIEYEKVCEAIKVLNQSHWLMRHTALEHLKYIRTLYDKAITDAKSGDGVDKLQNRVSLALLGVGYYHIPLETARRLMCIDESGIEIKLNEAGSHAVCAANGVHYKPNLRAGTPIQPGKEYAVSSLMQLIAGNALAAAPSTLLSIAHISIVNPEATSGQNTIGGLVQAGLTITGMCLRDVLACEAALSVWESLLSLKEITALLQDSQHGFTHALKIAQIYFPYLEEDNISDDYGLFKDRSVAEESEALRRAFEQLCMDKSPELRLVDIQIVMESAEHNRPAKFWGQCCEHYVRFGGKLTDLKAVVGILYQYPALMKGQRVSDILQQLSHLKRLFKLFPQARLDYALCTIHELLTPKYLDTEAFSALWIGLLLTLPCDAKADNFILQVEYNADQQVQHCRIVSIDNDLSLKMPFSLSESGQYLLEIKNTLLTIPGLMHQRLHPVIRDRLLTTSAESQFLTWLCLLARRDSDYHTWQQQGTVTENMLLAVDIPVQLPEQVWAFIKVQWVRLSALVKANDDITLGECFKQLYPLVEMAYQGLQSMVSTTLDAEAALYQFFKVGGSCPVERLIRSNFPHALAESQFAIPSPMVSGVAQCKALIMQLEWGTISPSEQWSLVEAIALLPSLTLKEWQGAIKTAIVPFLNRWLQEAVSRGSPFVAHRLLQLGANVSATEDESKQTTLHYFCRHYLNYPNSEAVSLMAEALFAHHSCQPNKYNAHGYTPLLQWINVTPEASILTPEQIKSAFLVLDALIRYGANLEAKDAAKHETALDKTLKPGREKFDWFVALIERGAGIHANGMMIVEQINALKKVGVERMNDVHIENALFQLAKRNLSVAWALSLQIWQTSKGNRADIIVHGTYVGEVVLPKSIAQVLLTEKQAFNSKGEIAEYGRRIVKVVSCDVVQWHVKEHPEMPGIEMAVKELTQLLFGGHTPPNELFSFFDNKGKPYPVLISQTVMGENLQSILNGSDDIMTENIMIERLANLHPQYLSEQIILAMLIHPEDGKPDNYQVLPIITEYEGKTQTSYRIVGIDNDHAFVNPIVMVDGKRKLQVKSILFCLEAMRKPVHSAVRERLLAIQPEKLLEQWLMQLIEYQKQSMVLFNKQSRSQLFKSSTNSLKVVLGRERARLPVVVTIPFRDKAITELWDRFVNLQTQLRLQPFVTHLQLLKAITPALGIRYEEAFELYEEPYEVKERFHEIAKDNYSTSIAGRYATLTTSRQALEAMGLSEKDQKALLSDDETGVCVTPMAALSQLREAVKQKVKIKVYHQALLEGKAEHFQSILSNQVKADIVNKLDFSQLLLPNSKVPDVIKQMAILNILVNEKIAFQTLSIQHCAALTDIHIQLLLENSPGLTKLTLVNCPEITGKIGVYIEKYTPHLSTLTLMQLPKLLAIGEKVAGLFSRRVYYNSINLQQLKRVNISGNLQLEGVAIQCPQLIYATLASNSLLSSINLLSERLEALDLRYCQQLSDETLIEQLRSYAVLPRLNLEGSNKITSGLLHCMSARYPDLFSSLSFNVWQSKEWIFKTYMVSPVTYVDCKEWNGGERRLVFALLSSNENFHTLIVNISEVALDEVLPLLCESIANNLSVQSICVHGAELNDTDKRQLLAALSGNKGESEFADVGRLSTDVLHTLKQAINHPNVSIREAAVEVSFELALQPSLVDLKSAILAIVLNHLCESPKEEQPCQDAVSIKALHQIGSFVSGKKMKQEERVEDYTAELSPSVLY